MTYARAHERTSYYAHTCTATKPGTYKVRGADGSVTGTATLAVVAGGASSLVLAPATAYVTAGTPQAYTARGLDSYGNSLGDLTADLTSLTISPTIDGNRRSTGAVCKDATHTCTATEPGTYHIDGWSLNDGAGGKATLVVTAGPLDRLTLSPPTATVAADTDEPYTATSWDAYGNQGPNVTSTTTFTITGGPGSGAVCNNITAHTCTAYQPGTYTITGTSAGKTGKATLIISPRWRSLSNWLGTAVSVGRNGSVWILGSKPVAGNYPISRYNGTGWTSVAGGAVRIAVDPSGNPWIVNSAHHIYHWNGKGWTAYPGAATDIAVGANGSLWILGTNPASAGNYGIYHWNGKSWTSVPGGAVRIAVDPSGNPWIVNSPHHIYHWNGKGWTAYPGAATDIAVGANGSLWIVGTVAASAGYQIFLLNGSTWVQMLGGALHIAAGPSSNVWIVSSSHRIYGSY